MTKRTLTEKEHELLFGKSHSITILDKTYPIYAFNGEQFEFASKKLSELLVVLFPYIEKGGLQLETIVLVGVLQNFWKPVIEVIAYLLKEDVGFINQLPINIVVEIFNKIYEANEFFFDSKLDSLKNLSIVQKIKHKTEEVEAKAEQASSSENK